MTGEQRQFRRLGMRLSVAYTVVGTGRGGSSLTKDFSGGGVCFPAEHALIPGTQLEVTMRLPDRPGPITFRAEVVWSKPIHQPSQTRPSSATEVGVRFVQIDPKDLALIKQYAILYPPPSP